MRQRLVNWLSNEIVPNVKAAGEADRVILKFAKENNLPPALVEGLGQLFNTASTLAHFDKMGAENRGKSFPILDVPKMVAEYLEVRPKMATDHEVIPVLPESVYFEGENLPDFFDSLMNPHLVRRPEMAKAAAAPVIPLDIEKLKLQSDWLQEISEEVLDKRAALANHIAEKISQMDYAFHKMDADARAYFDDSPEIKQALDQMAVFCKRHDAFTSVKRAAEATPSLFLLEEETSVMKDLDQLMQLNSLRKAAAQYGIALNVKMALATHMRPINLPHYDPYQIEMAKTLRFKDLQPIPGDPTSTVFPEGKTGEDLVFPFLTELSDDGLRDMFFADQSRPAWAGLPRNAQGPVNSAGDRMFAEREEKKPGPMGKAPPTKAEKTVPKPPKKSGPETGAFDSLNRGLSGVIAGGLRKGLPTLTSGVLGMGGDDQEQLDTTMRDTQNVTMLQRLMASDAILSEADPDQVVSIYNTVRKAAPELAGDINVMRVLLRSAVQHDGISPFDLKGLLDTELSQQRVNAGQRKPGKPELAGKGEKND